MSLHSPSRRVLRVSVARILRVSMACLALALAVSAQAQPYSIGWYTVDGGGHGPITGGTYSLQGTTGQPDASGALTGGSYSVIGGYWTVALPQAPTVASPSSTAIAAITATLNANVTSDGGAAVTERGFVFSVNATNPDPVILGTGVTKVVVAGTTGAFSTGLSSLTPATTYAFKGYATNSVGTSYTSVATFTTIVPAISISDVTVSEGNSGATNAVFTVTLSVPSTQTVTVSAATSNLSAVAGSDYTATGPSTLTFGPMVTTQNFSVPVLGDTVLESTETFQVKLTSPTNATIADDIGIGTITNDDGAPPSRVFVSESGSDANVCSNQLTPCRNIGPAIAQLAIDGEVIVLSPGEYDTAPILIGKGLKITSPSGTVAFIRQPITVNAPGGRVALRGLTLKGDPAAGSQAGVTLTTADSLSIEEVTFDRWAYGIDISTIAASNVSIANSNFLANGTGVISGGVAGDRVSVSESRFEGNSSGLDVQGGAFMVRQSLFTANGSGIQVQGTGTSVDISRSEFWGNLTGIWAGPQGAVRIGRSHVFGNILGLSADASGSLVSFGSNVVRRNTTNTQGTITTVPEQ